MFEDSTFESQGRIRTRSRAWMLATLAFNGSILIALVLLPLVYPEALPRQAALYLMEAPPPPPPTPPPPPPRPATQRAPAASERILDQLVVPRSIPTQILIARSPEPPALTNVAAMDPGAGKPGGNGDDPFHGQPGPRVVHPADAAPLRISSGVAASIAIERAMPIYPAIAKAAGVQGTVVLAATISKLGTIENLHVISGPAMLQQAAVDAVRTWRFRPYQLNGQPVEVETTVNVVFNLQH